MALGLWPSHAKEFETKVRRATEADHHGYRVIGDYCIQWLTIQLGGAA
jgi:hypothetical protein